MITYSVDLCCDGPNCGAMVGAGPEGTTYKAVSFAVERATYLAWKKKGRRWLCPLCQRRASRKPLKIK